MASASLGEALDQRFCLGVEEQHAQVDLALAQLGHRPASALSAGPLRTSTLTATFA